MLVEDQYGEPYETQHGAGQFTHMKRPRDIRHVVQENVGQRGIFLHIRHAIMDDHHNERRNPRYSEQVAHRNKSFPYL
jgi:hypothetical protein